MFEYYNNTLCVQGNWLATTGVVTLEHLKKMYQRGQVKRARAARGLGNCALYIYASLPERFKNIIEHDLGINPYEQKSTINFSEFLKSSETALAYFSNYELEDGRYLSEANADVVEEYTANVVIFNAIEKVIGKVVSANPKINKAELWQRITDSIHGISDDLRIRYPFDLPENSQALRAKYEACVLEKTSKRYPRPGIEGLIHNNYCHTNSLKITEDVGKWLIVKFGYPNKPTINELWKDYEFSRSNTGFPRLSESAIQNYLMKPENERIWYETREGKEEYDRKYGHTIKRNRETMFPNIHWAIDGTKFDAIYQDEAGKMKADKNIDVVIDVYSEKIIGWSFSDSETHKDHFVALRMAVNTACAKPYLFTYDAQSGHKSKKMQELYSKVVAKGGTHYHHKVGRKSSPAEPIFHRFQSQILRKYWFFDGQGIKSKQNRSKANFDFIKANKSALPTLEELYKYWLIMVDEWNAEKHPKYKKTRNEVYSTKTEHRQELDPLEQISMFWLTETKPKKYYPHGMPLTVTGVDYDFEVYDKEGNIDEDFCRKYVNTKLIVAYDPDYLDQYIKLYTLNEREEKVFVAFAQKKRQHHQVPFLLTKEGSEKMRQDVAVKDSLRMKDKSTYDEFCKDLGIYPEDLIKETEAKLNGNLEFEMKMHAFGTKDEQIATNKRSLTEKLLSN